MNGGDKTIVKDSVLNKYCWISSTFTLPKHFEVSYQFLIQWKEKGGDSNLVIIQGTLNQDFIHHGVGPGVEGDEKIYHQYYQWVPLVLSLQVSHHSPAQFLGNILQFQISGCDVLLTSLDLEGGTLALVHQDSRD